MQHILVTGGCGYIGSHTVVELLKGGYRVTVLDNLRNSSLASMDRVRQIAGDLESASLGVSVCDLLDKPAVEALFCANEFDAVIHFAGLKAVGESVSNPLEYYHTNITGTLNLLDVMKRRGCKSIVFSSSATVYGDPERVPVDESCALRATNPYGRTKLFIEEILRDLAVSDPEWNITILRYFNPVGAHSSGLIGEDPKGIPNNLMPFIQQVAIGRRSHLNVFGGDYPTPDGTGMRDYIHVVDLADGHVCALRHMSRLQTYNLGTGNGISVLDMVFAFAKAIGKDIPYVICPRRPGDVAKVYADSSKAREALGWTPVKTLDDMCEDAWRWQSQNPNGYTDV